MIAGLTEPIRSRWPASARFRTAVDRRFDPSLAVKLHELLTYSFTSETEDGRELGNRCIASLFERDENRAPAVRQLFDAENRFLSCLPVREGLSPVLL
jgi:hypothetical protein